MVYNKHKRRPTCFKILLRSPQLDVYGESARGELDIYIQPPDTFLSRKLCRCALRYRHLERSLRSREISSGWARKIPRLRPPLRFGLRSEWRSTQRFWKVSGS